MIDYDSLRAEIPARMIMRNIISAHEMLNAMERTIGFIQRPLFSDEIRSLEAGIRAGQGLLKKVMPDLRPEDLNTIKGRDRLQFISRMRGMAENPDVADTERRAKQLDAILEAVCDQRISIDEAKKIQDLLNSVVETDSDMPVMVSVPISDHELKNRLIHYGMMH